MQETTNADSRQNRAPQWIEWTKIAMGAKWVCKGFLSLNQVCPNSVDCAPSAVGIQMDVVGWGKTGRLELIRILGFFQRFQTKNLTKCTMGIVGILVA